MAANVQRRKKDPLSRGPTVFDWLNVALIALAINVFSLLALSPTFVLWFGFDLPESLFFALAFGVLTATASGRAFIRLAKARRAQTITADSGYETN